MSEVYRVSLDRAKSFDDRRAGYGWFDPFASAESFPASDGPAEVELELVPLETEMTPDEAVGWLDGQGKRSADPHETVEFGAAYPDLQKQGRIVAPGAVTQRPHVRRALCLDVLGADKQRILTFVYCVLPLPVGTRLLAKQK